MFNLESNVAKRRYALHFLRLTSRFEVVSARKWFPLLHGIYVDAANLLEQGVRDTDVAVNRRKESMATLLLNSTRQTLSFFGEFTFQEFRKEYRKYYFDIQKKSMEDIYWEEVSTWANFHAAKRVVDIAGSTRNMLQRELAIGMSDGLSTMEISKRIVQKSQVINKVRAVTIARTETHTAANRATNSAVKSTGFKHIRNWVTVIDSRTRGGDKSKFDHVKANGQRRDLNVPFDISGEKLDYPGDSSLGASAGNIVNCRCTLTFHTKRK